MSQPTPLDPTEVGKALFADVVERYINPELERRDTQGETIDGLMRFQVLLPDGSPTEIRLNEEVGGTLQVKASRGIDAGEEVMLGDIEEISAYEHLEKDADTPHVTAFRLASGSWSLIFCFASGHPTRHEHVALAGEFRRSATDAFALGNLGACLDTAYSAAELLAKAELLSFAPTVDLVLNKRDHGTVARHYHLWGHLGNTDPRFPGLLQDLLEVRGAARYLNKSLPVNR